MLIQWLLMGSGTQESNFWHTLAEVHFVSEKDSRGYTVEKPVFSQNLRSYHGRQVKLKGYLIPLSESGGKGNFMLSALPFNVCYFCGAAGPETVVEVQSTQDFTFTTKRIQLQGTLHLNDTDPDHHIYILKTATLLP